MTKSLECTDMSISDSENIENKNVDSNIVDSFEPVDFLEKANGIVPTVFIRFDAIITRSGRQNPFCFVEGSDEEEYYTSRVKAIAIGTSPIAIPCCNKDNVIFTKIFIDNKNSFTDCKLLYFVDKDYDNYKNIFATKLDIYVTDGYSVENYYCSDSFICKFAALHAEESDPNIHAQLKQLFSLWKSDWITVTKPFCAWLKAAYDRPMRKDAKDKHKKSFPNEYGEISHKGIKQKTYTYTQLNSDYGLTNPVTQQEYDNSLTTITGIQDIRGKFVIQLVEMFIEHIRLEVGKKNSILKKSFKFPLNRKTILERLSDCADTPASLISYIKSRI